MRQIEYRGKQTNSQGVKTVDVVVDDGTVGQLVKGAAGAPWEACERLEGYCERSCPILDAAQDPYDIRSVMRAVSMAIMMRGACGGMLS